MLNEIQQRLVSNAQASIQERMDEIQAEAQLCADEFWSKHLEYREGKEWDKTGRLGIRVRVLRGQVLIIWVRVEFWKPPRGGQWKVNYRDINKGRGYQYSISRLSALGRDWEVMLIEQFEPRFGVMRKELNELATIRKKINEYESNRSKG